MSSHHFENSIGQCLRPDEYPTTNLPVLKTPVRKHKSPRKRVLNENNATLNLEYEAVTDDDTLLTASGRG